MRTKKTSGRRRLTEEDIDNLVVEQAGDDSAWEAPVQVRRGEAGENKRGQDKSRPKKSAKKGKA